MKKHLRKALIQMAKHLKILLSWLVIITAWALWIFMILAIWFIPYWIIIFPLLIVAVRFLIFMKHKELLKYVSANTIIHGPRRSGKGLIYQYFINKNPEPVLTNIDYGPNSIIIDPETYFNSISPNTAKDFLQKKVTIVPKIEEWERKPYALDDGSLYFPNYEDYLLKKLYPSISLFIPVQGHLYDTFTVINIQDIERLYKLLKELQMDGYIKARSTNGFGYIWSRLPVLRKYAFIRWRYHQKIDSAINDILPFEKLGLLSKNNPMFTSTSSALKQQYTGVNGNIVDGFLFMKKSKIYYDTRIYHKVFFGIEAQKKEKIKKVSKKVKKDIETP